MESEHLWKYRLFGVDRASMLQVEPFLMWFGFGGRAEARGSFRKGYNILLLGMSPAIPDLLNVITAQLIVDDVCGCCSSIPLKSEVDC